MGPAGAAPTAGGCSHRPAPGDEEARAPPKTESRGVTARVGAGPREEEDEQKVLNLAVEHRSPQATPDTTPARTPTEESTPTSEPNPFLFQEGKLFEMTRSGAIDMTRRSYEEEGGALAFFQVGEEPPEEVLVRQEAKDALNLTLEVEEQVGGEASSQDRPDGDRPDGDRPDGDRPDGDRLDTDRPDGDRPSSTADASKSKIPKMGLSASAKLARKDQTAADCAATKRERAAEADTDPPEQVITTVQTAESTVTRPVYSQRGRDSSDSSPEESQETPKRADGPQQEAPGTPQARAAPSGRAKAAVPSASRAVSPPAAGKKEPLASESKSKIPIKAGGVRADSALKRAATARDRKLKVPPQKESRRKSEADAGASVGATTKSRSPKARSFCDGEPAARRSPASARSYQSRLPVPGRSGQTSAPATPTREKSHPLPETIDFFEEISDEAAKLVARLVQAEREAAQRDRGLPVPQRPVTDRPAETRRRRPTDSRAQSQGTPSTAGALLSLSRFSVSPVAVNGCLAR